MKTSVPQSDLPVELQRIYSVRFSGLEAYREKIWDVLVAKFFSQWISPSDAVLDVGCGYCEFINRVNSNDKFAMDLNPATRERVASDVTLFQQDCSSPWPLADNSLDVVFTSNFFEHLPTKATLQSTLVEAYRCLKPQGRLIAMGPNVKFLGGEYWDFFDHHLPLTELSLSESLLMAGYEVETALPKFLSYPMSQGSQPPIWALRLYLKIPVHLENFRPAVPRLAGRQVI